MIWWVCLVWFWDVLEYDRCKDGNGGGSKSCSGGGYGGVLSGGGVTLRGGDGGCLVMFNGCVKCFV